MLYDIIIRAEICNKKAVAGVFLYIESVRESGNDENENDEIGFSFSPYVVFRNYAEQHGNGAQQGIRGHWFRISGLSSLSRLLRTPVLAVRLSVPFDSDCGRGIPV